MGRMSSKEEPLSMAKRVANDGEDSPGVEAAQIANFEAETAFLKSRVAAQEIDNKYNTLKLEEAERNASTIRSVDLHHRIYDFDTLVEETSVRAATQSIGIWARQGGEDITIRINSNGGVVEDGLALFDYIRGLAAKDKNGNFTTSKKDMKSGIFIITAVYGIAASMAAVLLQAGNKRVATPHSFMMVHDIKTQTRGNLGQVQDDLKAAEKWNNILQKILLERSSMTSRKFKELVSRKDFYIDPTEAVKLGLVDEVGYV